ncbi:MAG: nucleoside transporter C-terminal domain-containing protein [Thermoanaerobaculales bacterium]|nr:nucleoside transporter C-terminal domain-containing protein [Thermoanaerobaculales bacterium]
MILRLVSLAGIFVFVGAAWLLSVNRKGVSWRPVVWGLGLQLLLGAVVLTPALQDFFFTVVDGGVRRLLSFAEAGSDFVFQSVEAHRIDVVADDGISTMTVAGHISPPLKTVAFWILPSIIFFSSLMAILYHLRVMQPIIEALGRLMQRTMGTSAAESLSAAANIFVGQTEAPLVIRPFIAGMTRSELHAVMCGGFATIAGGVMAAYVGFLRDIPGIAGHLVTASILSAPASLAIAKILYPEDGEPETSGDVKLSRDSPYGNVIEAAATGATDGMKLAINVAAMLIAFVALVAMLDWFLTWIPVAFTADGVAFGLAESGASEPLSLARILGWCFFPVALLMGITPADAAVVGRLLGEKLVLTEFIAYVDLGAIVQAEAPVITQRSAIIASYAICGFANFAAIGVQLGGIGGMAPERLPDLSRLALRAMTGGFIAACMTGAVVGLFLG